MELRGIFLGQRWDEPHQKQALNQGWKIPCCVIPDGLCNDLIHFCGWLHLFTALWNVFLFFFYLTDYFSRYLQNSFTLWSSHTLLFLWQTVSPLREVHWEGFFNATQECFCFSPSSLLWFCTLVDVPFLSASNTNEGGYQMIVRFLLW